MFVFLVRYKDSFSSQDFRSKFRYAVWEFVGDKINSRRLYSDIWGELNIIAGEARKHDSDSGLVEKLINECIEGKHASFSRDFLHYFRLYEI